MTIKLYKPTNPLLKKYIECIYILKQTPEEKPAKYLTFPSLFTIVTISEKTKTVEKGNNLTIKYFPTRPIETSLVCNFSKPVCIEYKGEINEITIYFKPLGINIFLDNELKSYSKGKFPDFNPFEDYKSNMIKILSIQSDEEKIEALEVYWLSKLKKFQEPLLEEIISEMMNINNSHLSITELSIKTGKSRTTINKHFDKHICKTPLQFKKILRFRTAMMDFQKMSGNRKLTNITYNLDYFDQSHMIKDFKTLTGFTPRNFFSKVKGLENGEIKWIFL